VIDRGLEDAYMLADPFTGPVHLDAIGEELFGFLRHLGLVRIWSRTQTRAFA